MPCASFVTSLIMEMTYGIDITNTQEQFLRATVEVLPFLNKVLVPGAFLVDIIPIRVSHEASRTPYGLTYD